MSSQSSRPKRRWGAYHFPTATCWFRWRPINEITGVMLDTTWVVRVNVPTHSHWLTICNSVVNWTWTTGRNVIRPSDQGTGQAKLTCAIAACKGMSHGCEKGGTGRSPWRLRYLLHEELTQSKPHDRFYIEKRNSRLDRECERNSMNF